jgi:hypothetical protein
MGVLPPSRGSERVGGRRSPPGLGRRSGRTSGETSVSATLCAGGREWTVNRCVSSVVQSERQRGRCSDACPKSSSGRDGNSARWSRSRQWVAVARSTSRDSLAAEPRTRTIGQSSRRRRTADAAGAWNRSRCAVRRAVPAAPSRTGWSAPSPGGRGSAKYDRPARVPDEPCADASFLRFDQLAFGGVDHT